MSVVTTINGVNMIALAYRAKSDNDKKEEANKANFLSYFLATDCVTTLPGIPSDKKQHYRDGTISPSKFINRCKCVEEYYGGMPASDIVK